MRTTDAPRCCGLPTLDRYEHEPTPLLEARKPCAEDGADGASLIADAHGVTGGARRGERHAGLIAPKEASAST